MLPCTVKLEAYRKKGHRPRTGSVVNYLDGGLLLILVNEEEVQRVKSPAKRPQLFIQQYELNPSW